MIGQTMSVKEAADYLKVTPRTVREWIKHGRLPASRAGRFYIIAAHEVGRMLAPVKITDAVPDIRSQAAAFRSLLRSGRMDRAACVQDRRAELEADSRRGY